MSEQPPLTTGLGVAIPSPRREPTARSKPATEGRTRTFRGFAVLDPAGSLVWGSFRITEAEAAATFRKWNPGLEGARAVPVKITIEPT